MFEVTGDDIAGLSDGDLRTLVARLALAELRRQGCPLSAVTAGGNQDAADGGLDVRVRCPDPIGKPDFVPRPNTGFQVKKPDMPASAISNEMRPEPHCQLRDSIRALAYASGAYIIVSAQGTLAETRLAERRQAMRDALHDLPERQQLHTDFYDRDRLATWVNEYPGIAAWVRDRRGRGLSGWSNIGDWYETGVAEPTPYLISDTACLTDERSRDRQQLTISEGIGRLRAALSTPKQCIRLIGLSGLGKTRLVRALFESAVGDGALDPSLAVYTDYSVETDPTARDMARQLVASGQRAILVVDNCNPATHAQLAEICSSAQSQVSLLTVEYDVSDDVPERTEVFRLKSTSVDLVAKWLAQTFPDISGVDQNTIAEFSDGNFRVARALAETLGRGETLGRLKGRDLFERIFQQRNQPDRELLLAAEDLSLFYSVDGADTSGAGELHHIGLIRSVAATTLYGQLAELQRRGIAQTRGRWRAILPHAIANRLAGYVLQRIPPVEFDRFAASLPPRMQKSLSRRLGYLDDSVEAQAAASRILMADGPLGNILSVGELGLDILTNLAPLAPEATLSRIEHELSGPRAHDLFAPAQSLRSQYIRLIKALAYDPQLFERAAVLLARFLAAEPEDNKDHSAHDPFIELFHLYLSGTKAAPEQRRQFIRRLAASSDTGDRRCAADALDALLHSHHFHSSGSFDFGARSRDWGWQPETHGEVWDWYTAAIRLAVELQGVLVEAPDFVASSARQLWAFEQCHDALEHASTEFARTQPWIKGWIAFRSALGFDGKSMPEAARTRLQALIDRLKPVDLLNRARALVLNTTAGGLSFTDGDGDDGGLMRSFERAAEQAREVGCALSQDHDTAEVFLRELFSESDAPRAIDCGRGLAEGASDLEKLWRQLVSLYEETPPEKRNANVLGGYLLAAHQLAPSLVSQILDNSIGNEALRPTLPYLQARAGIDDAGIARLRRAIALGVMQPGAFRNIANGVVADSPPDPLADLLLDIASLPDGVEVAIDILHMRLYCDQRAPRPYATKLISAGRELLRRVDFANKGAIRIFQLETSVSVCCAGPEGEDVARALCESFLAAMRTTYFSHHDLRGFFKAIFATQPTIALDAFLLQAEKRRLDRLFEPEVGSNTPVEEMDASVLHRWADVDPVTRYPLLGHAMSMFKREDDALSPLFFKTLDQAPDKIAFIGKTVRRLIPGTYSGSLADILARRNALLLAARPRLGPDAVRWIESIQADVLRWIATERERDRNEEQSFE